MTTFKFPTQLLAQDIAIVGRKGSGKTYTAKGMVESLLTAKRRVCIVDPLGVWWGLRASADGKRAGFSVVVFGGPHADVPISELSGEPLALVLAQHNMPAIVDLSEMLIGQRHRFMTEFAAALYRWNKTPLHLVIDEADEFAPQQPLPETRRMLHQIDRIVRRGRVRGFRVMLITQRPAVLNKNVLTQANTLIAMRLTAPQDRNAINAWVEGQADKDQAKAVLGSLASLQRGEGWVWAPELDMLSRVTFPRITTFDSSRSPEDDEVVEEPTKLAAVDISAITASFKAIEQEAVTVKELQAELTKLRKQVKDSSVAAGPPGVSEAEVRRRIDEAVAKVPKADPVVQQALNDALGTAHAAAKRIVDAIDAALAHRAGRESAFFKQMTAPAEPIAPGSQVSARAQATEAARQRATDRMLERSTPNGVVVAGDVTVPQQKILDVLAQLEMFDITVASKPMVAAHAGVSPTSGGYFNNLGKLRSSGLIEYPGPGDVALTAAGKLIANYPNKAPSLQDLHDSWLGILPAPQALILDTLIRVYPDSIQKDDLADRIGVSKTSGGYFNNLGRLRTLGAIDYPAKGHAAAAALLFPKGTR